MQEQKLHEKWAKYYKNLWTKKEEETEKRSYEEEKTLEVEKSVYLTEMRELEETLEKIKKSKAHGKR